MENSLTSLSFLTTSKGTEDEIKIGYVIVILLIFSLMIASFFKPEWDKAVWPLVSCFVILLSFVPIVAVINAYKNYKNNYQKLN